MRPLTHRDVVAVQEQIAWFRTELTRHTPCFTRQAWHTFTDVLNEVPYADIAERDSMTVPNVRQRYERLLTFLRSHMIHGATSWQEEQRKRTYGMAWQVHLATAAAAADRGGVVELTVLRCVIPPGCSRPTCISTRSGMKWGTCSTAARAAVPLTLCAVSEPWYARMAPPTGGSPENGV